MSAQENLSPVQFQALDPYYNEIPETRGTSRTKGGFAPGESGRDRADAEMDAHRSDHPVGCIECQKRWSG